MLFIVFFFFSLERGGGFKVNVVCSLRKVGEWVGFRLDFAFWREGKMYNTIQTVEVCLLCVCIYISLSLLYIIV